MRALLHSLALGRRDPSQGARYRENQISLRDDKHRASKLTMKRSDATVFCLTIFTECHWPILAPDDEPVFHAIVEQMQAELGLGALATSEILVSYLKIFLIKATRLKISQDACATESLAHRIPPILDRLKALIEQHYRSKHRPAEYAKIVGMNPGALAKLTGRTFTKP